MVLAFYSVLTTGYHLSLSLSRSLFVFLSSLLVIRLNDVAEVVPNRYAPNFNKDTPQHVRLMREAFTTLWGGDPIIA